MILGTIASYIENQGVTLIIDGEESPTEKEYKFISSYQPKVNDRVVIEEIGDSYVVLGALTGTSTEPTVTYSLESGTSKNVVKLVDGSGATVSTVTVDNVANATNVTNAGKSLAIGSNPYTVQLKNGSGTVLNSVNVNGVQGVYNHAYAGRNLVQFRTSNNSTLQFRIEGGVWYTLSNS